MWQQDNGTRHIKLQLCPCMTSHPTARNHHKPVKHCSVILQGIPRNYSIGLGTAGQPDTNFARRACYRNKDTPRTTTIDSSAKSLLRTVSNFLCLATGKRQSKQ